MSKDRLSQYIRQRDVLLTGAREQLKGKRAYVYGSVIRAQGPFNDIDVTVVSPGVGEDNLVNAINGMPTQIDYVDFAQTIADRAIGSRDITAGLDCAVVADQEDVLSNAIERRKSELAAQGHYVIHLLSLEELQETNGRDVQQGQSFYAAKRKSGSKRSIMRGCIIAEAMSPSGLDVTDESTRFERLYDLGIIDEEILTAMFSVQAMLPYWRRGNKPEDWDRSLGAVSSWARCVTEQGLGFVRSTAPHYYNDNQLTIIAEREMILDPGTTSDDLLVLWKRLETAGFARLREVAVSLVQHENFPTEEILRSDILSFLPDVRFLLEPKE